MPKPIMFKGKEYASEEEMPPRIREIYRVFRDELGLRDVTEATLAARFAHFPAAAAPAWGRADGSVAVPSGFEDVKELGLATAVHLENPDHSSAGEKLSGLARTLGFGRHAPKSFLLHTLVVYREGIAGRTRLGERHAWRWEDVNAIHSDLREEMVTQSMARTRHHYELELASGERVVLDEALKDVVEAARRVKAEVFARLRPPLAERYAAGERISFGPVTVGRNAGIDLGDFHQDWADVLEVQFHRGRMVVQPRAGKPSEMRASEVPNVELLCELIGVKMNEASLIYF